MQPRLPVELIASEETGFTEEVDIPPEVPPANIEPEGPPEQLMIVPESVPIDPPLMESVILGNTPPIMTQTSGIMKLVNYSSPKILLKCHLFPSHLPPVSASLPIILPSSLHSPLSSPLASPLSFPLLYLLPLLPPLPIPSNLTHSLPSSSFMCLPFSLFLSSYMPSAPSPTFPALGTSPVLLSHDDGFSFMHESELDRSKSSLWCGKGVVISCYINPGSV